MNVCSACLSCKSDFKLDKLDENKLDFDLVLSDFISIALDLALDLEKCPTIQHLL